MIPGTHARLNDELVVIIGGGIGGLATALALQQEGARVEVYERDTDFEDRKQGYGLTLTHNETGPLAKLGVLDIVKTHDATASPSARHFIFDGSGALLGFYGNDFIVHSHEDSDEKCGQLVRSESTPTNSTASYQRGNLRIPRQELRRVLLERLQPGTVHWGKKLETLEPIVRSCDEANASGKDGSKSGQSCDEANASGKDGSKSGSKAEREACAAVRVRFTDGTEAEPASLVVASDGIRSIARSCVDGPGMAGPSYTGIFIVLGLSPADHPLIRGGGFYTYDGAQRLFTMPFNADPLLTMWQLSFPLPDLEAAQALASAGGAAIIAEVLKRTAQWHAPVAELVSASAAADVWATPLYDRVPEAKSQAVRAATVDEAPKSDNGGAFRGAQSVDQGPTASPISSAVEMAAAVAKARALRKRVCLIGDAAHPMTPFKGQGANQALCDAARLATWLQRAPVPTALKGFEREMVAASGAKVNASREAAGFLHSNAVLQLPPPAPSCNGAGRSDSSSMSDSKNGSIGENPVMRFAGVSKAFHAPLVERLTAKGIGAATAKASAAANGSLDTAACDSSTEVRTEGAVGPSRLIAAVAAELTALEAEFGSEVREAKPQTNQQRKKDRRAAAAAVASASTAAGVEESLAGDSGPETKRTKQEIALSQAVR